MTQTSTNSRSTHLAGLVGYADALQIVWRRKSWLLFSLVLSVILGAVYYTQAPPIYQSKARVLVVNKRPESVTGQTGSASQVEDFVSTHRVLVQSPIIVSDAVEQNNLSALESLLDPTMDTTTKIISDMMVSRVALEAEGIMEVRFRCTDPEASETVLNSILASYKNFLEDTYRDMSQDTVELIAEARNVLENELRQKESEYREFRRTSPLISMGSRQQIQNLGFEYLLAIENERTRFNLLRADLQSRLHMVERAKEERRPAHEQLAMITKFSEESLNAEGSRNRQGSSETDLLPLLLEEQRLKEDFGSQHPAVMAIRERIETAHSFFVLPSASYESVAKETDQTNRLIDTFIRFTEDEIERLDSTTHELEQLYQSEYAKARELTTYELQDEQFRSDIKRSESMYDGLIKRLQDADLVADFGGFEARIIAPAGLGEKVSPRLPIVFGAALVLGLTAGGCLAFVAEIKDRRFHAPDEIHNYLELPILGHIPIFEPISDKLVSPGDSRDRRLCVHFQPQSPEAEAYRAIRTALYFAKGRDGQSARVVQVTSPSPGDGKSTLASNLAVSIGTSGRSVLLIDADLRKPRQHAIFNVKSEIGLADIIASGVEPNDAIQETTIPNLSLLPSGPHPKDPAELLSMSRFADLLRHLAERFDYVLVDTAPVLAVTDPSIVAAHVDGTLLAIRLAKSSKLQADRTKEILQGVDANFLGIAVNGVGGADTRYYHYDYQYGYGREANPYLAAQT